MDAPQPGVESNGNKAPSLVSALTNDSIAFADRILTDTGVAMTPGVDFDAVDGRSHMRISYAGSTQDMKKAVQRLNDWLGSQGR